MAPRANSTHNTSSSNRNQSFAFARLTRLMRWAIERGVDLPFMGAQPLPDAAAVGVLGFPRAPLHRQRQQCDLFLAPELIHALRQICGGDRSARALTVYVSTL
jgi:hypothetical protein